MMSKIILVIEKGFRVMRSNSRMLLVAVLVLVFPLLFTWLTHNFYVTASANIETVQKQKVSILHKSLSSVVSYGSLDSRELIHDLISDFKSNNKDISKIRIVTKDENGFMINFDLDESIIGTYERSDRLYRDLPAVASRVFIYPLQIEGSRIWQTLSKETLNNQEVYFFVEHNFDFIDKVMYSRNQQSYFGLTAIFLFLIALAYWLNKQVYWQAEHEKLKIQLNERDTFAGMIAHEFRTPLTIIKGYTSFLGESKTMSSEDMRFVKNIHTATERLVLLVNDFLEVTRLQSGRIKIERSKVDLSKIILRVCDDLKPLASKKNLKLVSTQFSKPITIISDEKRLTQILVNIITNAIKYTDSGTVTVESSKQVEKVVILVKDTGTSISAEDQQKLFMPFTRVGGVDETSTTGTGLGMWITKQLVALLGGTIGVESIKGVGTHMVITLNNLEP